MERKLDFSQYVVGRIVAAHNASERFKECDEKMRLANNYNPKLDRVTVKVNNPNGSISFTDVNKRMIFGMYLVRRTILRDLAQAGEPEISGNIDKMFHQDPPLENRIIIPRNPMLSPLSPADYPKGIPQRQEWENKITDLYKNEPKKEPWDDLIDELYEKHNNEGTEPL